MCPAADANGKATQGHSGGFLAHNVLFRVKFSHSLPSSLSFPFSPSLSTPPSLTCPLCILWFPVLSVYGILECSSKWFCVYFCFSCLFLGPFPRLFVCFVLFCCVCVCLIILCFYSLDACLLSNERQKGGGCGWEGKWA